MANEWQLGSHYFGGEGTVTFKYTKDTVSFVETLMDRISEYQLKSLKPVFIILGRQQIRHYIAYYHKHKETVPHLYENSFQGLHIVPIDKDHYLDVVPEPSYAIRAGYLSLDGEDNNV